MAFSRIAFATAVASVAALQLKDSAQDTAKAVDLTGKSDDALRKAGVNMDKEIGFIGGTGSQLLEVLAQGSLDNWCCPCRVFAGLGKCEDSCGFDTQKNIACFTPAGTIVFWLQVGVNVVNQLIWNLCWNTKCFADIFWYPYLWSVGGWDYNGFVWQVMNLFGITVCLNPTIYGCICCPFLTWPQWCAVCRLFSTGWKACKRSGAGDENAWLPLNCQKAQKDSYMNGLGSM